MLRWRVLRTSCLWAACLGLALAQDLPPISISGQSSGPAAVYSGPGAGAQDATCNSQGPRKQCGVNCAGTPLLRSHHKPYREYSPSVSGAHAHIKLASACAHCHLHNIKSLERASVVTLSVHGLLTHRSRVH